MDASHETISEQLTDALIAQICSGDHHTRDTAQWTEATDKPIRALVTIHELIQERVEA